MRIGRLPLEDDERADDVEPCLDHRRELTREDLQRLRLDALERAGDLDTTRHAGGYRARAKDLAATLKVTKTQSALLRDAAGVLVVDDVVTYGSTFEACAIKLQEVYPHLRVYGAALAYVETPERRERAELERARLEQ